MPEPMYQTLSGSFGPKKWVSAAASATFGDAEALIVAPSRRAFTAIEVGAVTLQNYSGATAVMGLATRYKTSKWTAGQVTAAGVYTDDTTDAQSAATGDFSLHDRTDSGSGFLVSADERFNILGLIQSAAGDQTTPVKLVEYWDGTSWVNIATSLLIGLLTTNLLDGDGTGEKVLCWPMPFGWVVGGSGTGVPATKYNLRVRHTHSGAGTANPVASQLFVGFASLAVGAVTNNSVVSMQREHNPLYFPRSGEALFTVTNLASILNWVTCDVAFWG